MDIGFLCCSINVSNSFNVFIEWIFSIKSSVVLRSDDEINEGSNICCSIGSRSIEGRINCC